MMHEHWQYWSTTSFRATARPFIPVALAFQHPSEPIKGRETRELGCTFHPQLDPSFKPCKDSTEIPDTYPAATSPHIRLVSFVNMCQPGHTRKSSPSSLKIPPSNHSLHTALRVSAIAHIKRPSGITAAALTQVIPVTWLMPFTV